MSHEFRNTNGEHEIFLTRIFVTEKKEKWKKIVQNLRNKLNFSFCHFSICSVSKQITRNKSKKKIGPAIHQKTINCT
jgi:hypothetical protein